jgi:hypothetical protein
MARVITANTLNNFSDEELVSGMETPGSLEIAGIKGFFSVLWQLIQLIAQAKGKLRARIEVLEANQAKISDALTSLQKELGLDEAELLKLVSAKGAGAGADTPAEELKTAAPDPQQPETTTQPETQPELTAEKTEPSEKEERKGN